MPPLGGGMEINMKFSQKIKFKIVVISIITTCLIGAEVLITVFCAKTDNLGIMPYIYAMLSFSFIVAIYAFITSNSKNNKE